MGSKHVLLWQSGKDEIDDLVDFILNYKIKYCFSNINFDTNKSVQYKANLQLMVKFSEIAASDWRCLCQQGNLK